MVDQLYRFLVYLQHQGIMLLLMVKLIKIVMPLRIKNFKDSCFPIWYLNQRPQVPHPKNQEINSREWEHDDPGKE
jgi:hypothetical protein